MYLVTGCFHWIGYHLIQKLLNQGYEVTGIDDSKTEQKEHFLLSVGRNSLFTKSESFQEVNSKRQLDKFTTTFLFDEGKELEKEKKAKSSCYLLSEEMEHKSSRPPNLTTIELPLIYGEWMPRDASGIVYQGQHIQFNSYQFKEQAIYIDDFIEALLQITVSRIEHKNLVFKPLRKHERTTGDETNAIYIREIKTIEERMEKANNHYQCYMDLYK